MKLSTFTPSITKTLSMLHTFKNDYATTTIAIAEISNPLQATGPASVRQNAKQHTDMKILCACVREIDPAGKTRHYGSPIGLFFGGVNLLDYEDTTGQKLSLNTFLTDYADALVAQEMYCILSGDTDMSDSYFTGSKFECIELHHAVKVLHCCYPRIMRFKMSTPGQLVECKADILYMGVYRGTECLYFHEAVIRLMVDGVPVNEENYTEQVGNDNHYLQIVESMRRTFGKDGNGWVDVPNEARELIELH